MAIATIANLESSNPLLKKILCEQEKAPHQLNDAELSVYPAMHVFKSGRIRRLRPSLWRWPSLLYRKARRKPGFLYRVEWRVTS